MPVGVTMALFKLREKISGVGWGATGKLQGEVSGLVGSFRASLTRTQLHSEAIAALGGAAVEKRIVEGRFEQAISAQRRLWDMRLRFQSSMHLCFIGLWPILQEGVTVRQSIVKQVAASSQEGILGGSGSVSERLGANAYAMGAMAQAAMSIGMIAALVPTMFGYTGQALRVMELLERLRGIEERKATTSQNHFIGGSDVIHFQDVDIETPTGNRLGKCRNCACLKCACWNSHSAFLPPLPILHTSQ